MFLAVWLLYVVDRLLDAHPLNALTWVPQVPAQSHRAPGVAGSHTLFPVLKPRHHFHRTYQTLFATGILLAAVSLAVLIPTFPSSLLRTYLILAAILAAWFALIHLTRLPIPKEFAPGLFFAATIFIPIPHATLPAILFAALCTLNCLYIYQWEHPQSFAESASRVPHPHHGPIVVRVGLGRRPTAPARRPTAPVHVEALPNAHPATLLALRHLPQLNLALALLPLARPAPIQIAITLSAFALLILDHHRHNLPPTTLRAAADLALLTPILVLPFLPFLPFLP